jgi:hypothetical protein
MKGVLSCCDTKDCTDVVDMDVYAFFKIFQNESIDCSSERAEDGQNAVAYRKALKISIPFPRECPHLTHHKSILCRNEIGT